jgi:hypothetical protein
MRYKLLITAIVVAGLVYLIFSMFFVDVQINKYTDIATVKEQKAMQKGWVPSILPESAYEITETHDINKNTLFGSFKYKEPDEKAFLTHLFPINDEKKTMYWEDFLFRVDKEKNLVKYRNRTLAQ